jgi:hypothetical protein
MTAASPGAASQYIADWHYDGEEAYVFALADLVLRLRSQQNTCHRPNGRRGHALYGFLYGLARVLAF